MKTFNWILHLALLISLDLKVITAQSDRAIDSAVLSWKSYFEQLYGTDYNLLNGTRYVNLYPTANGHPFLGDDVFFKGNIVISGKVYRDVDIKYDISSQEIILQYPHFSGNTDKIILNREFIDEFILDGKLFRKFRFPDTEPGFYQVVARGEISCLYYWKKDLLKGISSQNFFTYSPEQKKSYLLIDKKIISFRGRRSFIKAFPELYHKEILSFIKSNKIDFRNAADAEIRSLMVYCNQLMQNK